MTAVNEERRDASSDNEAWACIRTIIVPTGIAPVARRSPRPYRKRTPLRKHPDGEAMSRTGGREWFGERVFVETQEDHKRAGFGAALMVHVVAAILLLVAALLAAERTIVVTSGSSLPMPAIPVLHVAPIVERVTAAPRPVTQSAPRTAASPRVDAPAPPAASGNAAPTDTPAEIPTASVDESRDQVGVPGGVPGGVPRDLDGGVVDGSVKGKSAETQPHADASLSPAPSGPIRSINAPRKIKDVRPVYPPAAVAAMVRGRVEIEATIGPDGKVQDARILRSVGLLDKCALDAVRQWEYEPSRLNGRPVAVILTVVVEFGIQ